MTGRTIFLVLKFKVILNFFKPKSAAAIRFGLAGVVQLLTYGLIVLMFESYSENSFKEFAKLFNPQKPHPDPAQIPEELLNIPFHLK